jgi:hypothetical protein
MGFGRTWGPWPGSTQYLLWDMVVLLLACVQARGANLKMISIVSPLAAAPSGAIQAPSGQPKLAKSMPCATAIHSPRRFPEGIPWYPSQGAFFILLM